jgi:hypothetical protein
MWVIDFIYLCLCPSTRIQGSGRMSISRKASSVAHVGYFLVLFSTHCN